MAKETLENVSLIDTYKKIYPYIKPYIAVALLGIALTVPVGALDAVIAYFLKPFMDEVLVNKEENFTSYVPFIIIAFTLVQGIFIYLSAIVNGYVGNKITLNLRRDLYNKLIYISG